MKHELKRVKESTRAVGDIVLDAPVGQTGEYSSREAEVALATGDFEYVRQLPETTGEEAVAGEIEESLDARREELSRLSKKELLEMAGGLASDAMTKAEIVEAMLAPVVAADGHEYRI